MPFASDQCSHWIELQKLFHYVYNQIPSLKEWQFLQCLLYDNSNTIESDNNMHLALPAVELLSLHSPMEWPSIS